METMNNSSLRKLSNEEMANTNGGSPVVIVVLLVGSFVAGLLTARKYYKTEPTE